MRRIRRSILAPKRHTLGSGAEARDLRNSPARTRRGGLLVGLAGFPHTFKRTGNDANLGLSEAAMPGQELDGLIVALFQGDP
jgi:hypothetical protein